MPPASLLQQMTDEIIRVEALHDDDDRTLRLVIQPGQQSVGVPLLQGVPGALRLRLLRLQRVVDNHEITATTGQGATYRGRKPRTSRRGHDFGLGVLCWTDPGGGEYGPVKIGAHKCATIIGVLARKPFGITDTNDPAGGVMAENKGRQAHGGADGFETARRHGDDQPSRLTSPDMAELVADRLDVPVRQKTTSARDGRERRLHKGI